MPPLPEHQAANGLDDPGTAGLDAGVVLCGQGPAGRGAAARQQAVCLTVLTEHQGRPTAGAVGSARAGPTDAHHARGRVRAEPRDPTRGMGACRPAALSSAGWTRLTSAP